MTQTTDIVTAEKILSALLQKHGIDRIFCSPGSRNASILEQLYSSGKFKISSIVDERQAAFNALGYSSVSQSPSVLVCTSGTAPLNYAPALAEAYYRGIPLIAITADRPSEWIDQDDSQTLAQFGVYRNYIKRSYDIPLVVNEQTAWLANRLINEALLVACSGFQGPVHINIHIDQPTAGFDLPSGGYYIDRAVEHVKSSAAMSVSEVREMSKSLASPQKVMIVAGFLRPSSKLNRALSRLALLPNVVVLTETISNLHSQNFVTAIDRTLRCLPNDQVEDFTPDVVITLGGALVSRRIKAFLRVNKPKEHWFVGHRYNLVDCFKCLTKVVDVNPDMFFEQLASAMQIHTQPSNYADKWMHIFNQGHSILQAYVSRSPWSDMKAFSILLASLPKKFNLQCSNGTSIRYSQIFSDHQFHLTECNRGVSGIDGCVSTAVGAMVAYDKQTVLICGDTSAFYDMSALASPLIDSRMKIVIISNGGGGIFRYVNATRNLSIQEPLLSEIPLFPVRKLAESFGFRYFLADNENSMRSIMNDFIEENQRPALLEIITPANISADVLKLFLDSRLTECL